MVYDNRPTMLCDRILLPVWFAECMTGKYFTKCNTLKELISCCASCHTFFSGVWKLTEANQIPPEAYYVLVEVSSEEDYTKHEYYYIRVNKKYLARFKRGLKELGVI